MSIPPPTLGMRVALCGGRKDGERVRYIGPRLRVPVPTNRTYFTQERVAPPSSQFFVECYTLRQSQPDGHWLYVLDPP